ncbi:MAG: hypothetical protein ABSF77_19770 [Spirochaetia bacterium]|jgi:hypothetical protein
MAELKPRWPHPQDFRVQNDRTAETPEEKAESTAIAQNAAAFCTSQEKKTQTNEEVRTQRLAGTVKEGAHGKH